METKRICRAGLLMMVLLFIGSSAKAQTEVWVNGIKYNIYSNYASLADCPNDSKGVVTIPSKVSYNGKEYPVTSIERYSFHSCKKITTIIIPS